MEEVDKAEDKEVEVEVILKMKKRKLVCRIGMTANKGEAKEISQVAIGLSVLSDKHDHCVNEYRSAKCYNCGKANHKAKYCEVEKKKETNFLTKFDDVKELEHQATKLETQSELHLGW